MNEKYDIIPGLFWIGISAFAMIGAYKLGLGDFHDPGAGLMPFLIGAVLFLVSIPVVVKSAGRMKTVVAQRTEPAKIDFAKLACVAVSLFAYCLLLGRLGYLISTTLLLLFLFKLAGSRQWLFAIAGAVLTAVITYFGFTFLGLRFPRGMFGV